MKIKEIRNKRKEELKKVLEEKREVVRKLRFDIASKQVKNNREYRNNKKDIAKILTVVNEKKESN